MREILTWFRLIFTLDKGDGMNVDFGWLAVYTEKEFVWWNLTTVHCCEWRKRQDRQRNREKQLHPRFWEREKKMRKRVKRANGCRDEDVKQGCQWWFGRRQGESQTDFVTQLSTFSLSLSLSVCCFFSPHPTQ